MTKNYSCLIFFMLLMSQLSYSQDRVFTHTYQTNVLPLGVKEFEYWATIRSGRKEFYNAIDQRFELELGLGKKVQTAFYFNVTGTKTFDGTSIVNETETGFSNEWKFKLSDPVANKIGSALYAEIGFNGDEIEFEGKIILDKKFGNNLVAFNGVGEYEMKFEIVDGETETQIETPFELDFAYMHFPGSHSGIGLEVRNHNEVSNDEGWENSVWYAGPTLHFNGSNWFINVSAMPQLFNARQEAGSTETLDLEHHEKVQARVLVSFSF